MSNKKNKILLFIALLFLLIFAVNLSIIKSKNKKAAEQKNYEHISLLIEQKQSQAEANLLYSNEAGAKKLFDEIDILINELPQITDEQREKYSEFKKTFNLQMEEIRRVERIDQPEEIANFSNLTSLASPENIILMPEVNKIYAADSGQKSIYILDITDNIVTTLTDLKKSITSLKVSVTAANNIYYLNEENIIELSGENETLNELTINLPSEGDFAAAGTYNNRLYLLSPASSQIYRYNRSGFGFGVPYAWLQEKLDFESAVDIGIDGHVYILKNNGEIIKLLRGRLVDFKLEAVDPPIENASKLYVSPEAGFIYVLEPDQKRLIVYDKTGQFLIQYASESFSGLKDFTVDETNKIIYFLNNTSVLKIPARHFNE